MNARRLDGGREDRRIRAIALGGGGEGKNAPGVCGGQGGYAGRSAVRAKWGMRCRPGTVSSPGVPWCTVERVLGVDAARTSGCGRASHCGATTHLADVRSKAFSLAAQPGPFGRSLLFR